MKFLLQVRFNGADKVIGALPRRAWMRRSRSRRGSRLPGSAGPSRSARCWNASRAFLMCLHFASTWV